MKIGLVENGRHQLRSLALSARRLRPRTSGGLMACQRLQIQWLREGPHLAVLRLSGRR